MMMIMRNLQSKESFPDFVVWFLLASMLIRFCIRTSVTRSKTCDNLSLMEKVIRFL